MLINIIAGLLLLACICGAVTYILRQRKIAIENNNPICIGCPGASRCKGHCHSIAPVKKHDK